MSFHLWLALVLLFPVPNFSQNSAQPSVVQIDADHRNCYAVSNSSGSFTACLPDVIIAGHPKCGTSALFALIASHPQVVSTDNKEHCMSDPNDAESFLHPLLNASAMADKRYLSGCINKLFNENMFRVLQPRNRIRIVYIVRDYADMMWAAFNFWCMEGFDIDCVGGAWSGGLAGERAVYRTPELFHELLIAQSKGATALAPPFFTNPLIDAQSFFKEIQFYEATVGKDNVLVVDSNDLQHNPHATWHKISAFAGLTAKHPRLTHFQARRYNTQNAYKDRGASNVKNASDHMPGLYAASDHRPMMDATRQLIYKAWHEECTSLNAKYGLALKACSNGTRTQPASL